MLPQKKTNHAIIAIDNAPTLQPFDSMLDVLYAHNRVSQPQQLLALEQLERAIHYIFCQTPSPSPLWTAEFVSLAITHNPRRYKQVLSRYLSFLNNESLIEHHHIQGLADLLNLAQKKWIEKNLYAQIWSALQKHDFLWEVRNQDHRSLQATLALWQQLLCSFQEQNITITPEQKKTLTDLLDAYRNQFDSFGDPVAKESIAFAKQALLRIGDKDALPWVPVAVYLFSAFQNGMAVAAACASASTNFGVGLIGIIPPLVSGIGNLGSASALVCDEMKKKWNKKSWYYALRQLQCLLMSAAFTNTDENFPLLLNALMQFNHSDQIDTIAAGLLGTIVQILKHPFDENRFIVQQGCFAMLKYYFTNVTELSLKTRIFETLFSALGQQQRDENSYQQAYLTLATIPADTLTQMPLTLAASQGFVALYQWLEYKKTSASAGPEQQSLVRVQTDIINRCMDAFVTCNKKTPEKCVAGLVCLNILASLDTLHDTSLIHQTIDLLKNHDSQLYTTVEALAQHEQQQLALDLQPQSSLLLTAWSQVSPQCQHDLMQLRTLLSTPVNLEPSPSPASYKITMTEALIVWISAKQIMPNMPGLKQQQSFPPLIHHYESELMAHTQQFLQTEFHEISKQLASSAQHGSLAINIAPGASLEECYQQSVNNAKQRCMADVQSSAITDEVKKIRTLNIENRFAQLEQRFLNAQIDSTHVVHLLNAFHSDALLANLLQFYSLFEALIKGEQPGRHILFSPQESQQFIAACHHQLETLNTANKAQLKTTVLHVGTHLQLMGPLLAFSTEDFLAIANGEKNIVTHMLEKMQTPGHTKALQAISRVSLHLESINPLLEKMTNRVSDVAMQKKIQSWQERIAFYCLRAHQLPIILQQMYQHLHTLQTGTTAVLPDMQSLPALKEKIEHAVHHQAVLDNIKTASTHQQTIAKQLNQLTPMLRGSGLQVLEGADYTPVLKNFKAVFDRRLAGKNHFSDEVGHFDEIVTELTKILNDAHIDFTNLPEKETRANRSLNLINRILQDYRQKVKINPLDPAQKNDIIIIPSSMAL